MTIALFVFLLIGAALFATIIAAAISAFPISPGKGFRQRTAAVCSSWRLHKVGCTSLLSVLRERVNVRITRRGPATARAAISTDH